MSDMHPEDIKAEIRKAGKSITRLASDTGVSRQSIHMALVSRFSEKCERSIADCINVEPQDIWPSRFRADGTRIRIREKSIESVAA